MKSMVTAAEWKLAEQILQGMARKLGLTVDEARDALVEVIASYDPTRKSKEGQPVTMERWARYKGRRLLIDADEKQRRDPLQQALPYPETDVEEMELLRDLLPTGMSEDPLNVVLYMEFGRAVEQAMRSLSNIERSVVGLRMEGWSLDEIARELHCPVGTVKSHLCRARKKLRQALRDYQDWIN